MPKNPEQKPSYFQDVVVQEETEQAPEGFDLDREFGEGTTQRCKRFLEKSISELLEGKHYRSAVIYWPDYRVLFGSDPPQLTPQDREQMINALEVMANWVHDSFSEIAHRVLFAKSVWDEKGWKEAAKEMKERQEEEIKRSLEDKEFPDVLVAEAAHEYRILFGNIFWTEEAQARMEEILKNAINVHLREKDHYPDRGIIFQHAARFAADLRLLRAHELRFIPGKGIEIIDTPPPPFQQKPIPPMPEERKF